MRLQVSFGDQKALIYISVADRYRGSETDPLPGVNLQEAPAAVRPALVRLIAGIVQGSSAQKSRNSHTLVLMFCFQYATRLPSGGKIA